MKTITLGTTGITTPQNAFGALPVQRVNMKTSVDILHRAYDGGACLKRCPYELNIPTLLRKNLVDYKEILAGKEI